MNQKLQGKKIQKIELYTFLENIKYPVFRRKRIKMDRIQEIELKFKILNFILSQFLPAARFRPARLMPGVLSGPFKLLFSAF